jgi:hypothetical protein
MHKGTHAPQQTTRSPQRLFDPLVGAREECGRGRRCHLFGFEKSSRISLNSFGPFTSRFFRSFCSSAVAD